MNISDPIVILGFLFLGSPTSLPCPAAADGNDDDVLNLSDAISLLAFEFLGGSPPREPFSACGTDPTPGALGCTGSPNCR